MKIKYVVLLALAFFLTGCNVQYNLTIKGDKAIESFTALEDNFLLGNSKKEIEDYLKWTIVLSGDETEVAYFYDKSKILGKDESGIKYNYSFDLDKFSEESDVLNNCFNAHNVIINGNRIDISASGFMCSENIGSGNLRININVPGEVISGNFDNSEKNTYIWNFNSGYSKDIYLSVDRTNVDINEDDNALLIVVLAFLVLGGIIFLIAYKKHKSNGI